MIISRVHYFIKSKFRKSLPANQYAENIDIDEFLTKEDDDNDDE